MMNKHITAPGISHEELQGLVLRIEGVGDIQSVEAPLRSSRYVFSYLLDLCNTKKTEKVRGMLLRDNTLDIEDDSFWFYVLNELVRAGIVLPVVEREEVAA